MSLFDPIDIYCERLAPGLWAEPLNAVSNLSFFIAAYLLYRLLQRGSPPPHIRRENLLLIVLVALVGVGSTVFHTFANVIGILSDILGIMLFVHTYLYLCLRRLLGWSRLKSAISIVLLFGTLMLAETIPAAYSVNGSAAYFPCVFVLLGMRHTTRTSHPQASRLYLHATLWLIVSLTFRSIDMAACNALPIGTHLMWHICNGVVLYLLSKVLIQPIKSVN